MSKPRITMTKGWVLLLSFSLWLSLPVNADHATGRNFMLVFDVKDYSAQVKEAVTYLIDHVLREGDQLNIVSPRRLVGFSPDKLKVPKEQLIKHIFEILKADISRAMAVYHNTLKEMTSEVQSICGYGDPLFRTTPETVLENYRQHRKTLSSLRGNLEERLMKLNKIFRRFKRDNRENHLLMILQRELRPVPDKKSMSRIQGGASGFGFRAMDVFLGEQNKTGMDLPGLERAFKYAKVRFHLLYLQGKEGRHYRGIEFIDNSGDIYTALATLAKATDGIIISSPRPSHFLKKVEQLTEGRVEVEVIDQSVKKEGEK